MKILIIAAAVLFHIIISAKNPMKAPKGITHLMTPKNNPLNDNVIYNFYKKYISPIDGDRCIMDPSCSTFAKNAVNAHGAFMGLLLISDRLMRCGNDLYFYKKIKVNGKEYYLDPVP
ncbi:membrane protein insertion efficiency factor YidD [Calditrichota bacterium LG25]